MRLDRIYTKIGDKGTTRLANGQEVSKACARLEAYGTVDELNSAIGLLRDQLLTSHLDTSLLGQLLAIQHELFDLGGELATPSSGEPANGLDANPPRAYTLTFDQSKRLETEMDAMNAQLNPLANFVLPGGHVLNSTAHLARCICRRAERAVVLLQANEPVRAEALIYLNRLSDWLFIASRKLSQDLGVCEILWQQHSKASPLEGKK